MQLVGNINGTYCVNSWPRVKRSGSIIGFYNITHGNLKARM